MQYLDVYHNLERTVIAFGEKDDCTVRAISAAFDIPYKAAHDLCKAFGREDRQGFHITSKLTEILFQQGKLALISDAYGYQVDEINWQPDKTYLVLIAGHMFCIKQGRQINDLLNNSKAAILRLFEVTQ